jgi:hypothetical protein
MSDGLHRLQLQQELQQRAARGGSMVGVIAELHDVHARRHKLAMSLDGRVVATTGRVSVAGHAASTALILCGATPTNKVAAPRPKRDGKQDRAAEVLVVGNDPDQRAVDVAAKRGLLVIGEADLTEILRARASVMADRRATVDPAAKRARKEALAGRGKGVTADPARVSAPPRELPTPELYRTRLREREAGFHSRHPA